MKTLTVLLFSFSFTIGLSGQVIDKNPVTKIMTLGVFHFAYHNLDVVKTEKKNQISVLDEPYQSEIIAVSKAIEEYNPTIIAIEVTPDRQPRIDSLFLLYKSDRLILGKNETDQLAFRLGKDLNLNKIHCVNDFGRHYDNIASIFNDSTRSLKFEDYFLKSRDSIYGKPPTGKKVTGIIDELHEINKADVIRESLAIYLMNPFKYEEEAGDFTGVDFETGRWFNRNLRIFRNIQRIPHTDDDRILLIIGAGHLNLLNIFFDVSNEFELVSPLPYLD
ncbi:MAG: hypothetical protein GX876_06775, partial [Bacteroidales bacterium]|nr:hypothetical protein [Bacteroidales bacterium]